MEKKMHKTVYIMLLLAALMSCVSAESWTGQVITNNSSWQITRHSTNLTMDISGYVDGTISPVERGGRVLSPYAHYSKDVAANGADIKERTAAYQGKYTAQELLKMRSRISSVGYEIDKPAGTPIWTVEFYADWPVTINSSRSINYIGRNINDREFIGNGEDNVGANFLYNIKLTKEQNFNFSSQSLNATIIATDEQILRAKLDEDKEIDYKLNVHSTGIADLKSKQSGSQYLVGSSNYEILSENEERYVGDYNIIRNIRMRANHTREKFEDDNWLPCCSDGWAGMTLRDKIGHSAESVFDCTCFKSKGN
ncbi:MAG: hypothetical protein JW999_11350 [Methanotrichaceae archaeon]|nr:hypothetical protein [Methanotrichaceae archaeon]